MKTNGDGGYRALEIYKIAHALAIDVHSMSLKLPPEEKYDGAPQIRRSSRRVSADIVEGDAHRKYREQFLLCLYRALGSSEETREHLELLWKTKSLKDERTYRNFASQYDTLSRKITSFIEGVERERRPVRWSSDIRHPASDIPVEEVF